LSAYNKVTAITLRGLKRVTENRKIRQSSKVKKGISMFYYPTREIGAIINLGKLPRAMKTFKRYIFSSYNNRKNERTFKQNAYTKHHLIRQRITSELD